MYSSHCDNFIRQSFDVVMLLAYFAYSYICDIYSIARYQRFQVAFCGYVMLMHLFAATTIILLETTAHESSRRMLHSRHVKAVQQTTSTL